MDIDKYLEECSGLPGFYPETDDEYVEELAPIVAVPLAVAAVKAAASLFVVFIQFTEYSAKSKEDTQLTKEIQPLIGRKYKVVVVDDDEMANAFVADFSKNLYITSALKKMLTHREATAVMLHETYHKTNMHILKSIGASSATDAGFVAVLIPVLNVIPFAIAVNPLMPIFLLMMSSFAQMSTRRMIGRKWETQSDAYAAKYGYGQDLIDALHKIDKHYSKKAPKDTAKTPIGKAFKKLGEALQVHPPLKQRTEDLLKEKDLYNSTKKGRVSKLRKIISDKFKVKKGEK